MKERTTYFAVYEVPDDNAELSSLDSYTQLVSRHRFEWAARIKAWWRCRPRAGGPQPRAWVRREHVIEYSYKNRRADPAPLPRARIR